MHIHSGESSRLESPRDWTVLDVWWFILAQSANVSSKACATQKAFHAAYQVTELPRAILQTALLRHVLTLKVRLEIKHDAFQAAPQPQLYHYLCTSMRPSSRKELRDGRIDVCVVGVVLS